MGVVFVSFNNYTPINVKPQGPVVQKTISLTLTLVPEVYFYYFHCEGERENKHLVESGN